MQKEISKVNVFDSVGHLSEEGIAVCVDAIQAESYADLPEVIINHVEECGNCKCGIIETLGLLEDANYNNQLVSSRVIREQHSPRNSYTLAYRVAASIVVCISIGVLFYLIQTLKTGRHTIVESKGSIEITQKESRSEGSAVGESSKELAQNSFMYTTSPTLERLANAVTRSTSVVVVTPRNGVTLRGEIIFVWKSADSGKVALEILSNAGKPLHRFDRLST